MKISAYFFAIIMFLMTGCDDNVSRPPDDTDDEYNFMPLNIGSYWVYDSYIYNFNGKVEDTDFTDSVLVVDKIEAADRLTYFCQVWRDGALFDTIRYVFIGDKLYRNFSSENTQVKDMADTLLKIFDITSPNTAWPGYIREEQILFEYNFELLPAQENYVINFRRDPAYYSEFDTNLVAVPIAMQFDSRIIFKYNFGADTTFIQKTHMIVTNYEFVDSVGITIIDKEPSRIIWQADPPVDEFNRIETHETGIMQRLVRYKLK